MIEQAMTTYSAANMLVQILLTKVLVVDEADGSWSFYAHGRKANMPITDKMLEQSHHDFEWDVLQDVVKALFASPPCEPPKWKGSRKCCCESTYVRVR